MLAIAWLGAPSLLDYIRGFGPLWPVSAHLSQRRHSLIQTSGLARVSPERRIGQPTEMMCVGEVARMGGRERFTKSYPFSRA